MANHWYMYANNKFIAESVGCVVCLNQCPAIQHVSSLIDKIVYEPLINREFNIKAESVCDPDALKQNVLKICDSCQSKSR